MKTLLTFAFSTLILIGSASSFFISSHDMEMSMRGFDQYMEKVNQDICFEQIGTRSKIKCTIYLRNK